MPPLPHLTQCVDLVIFDWAGTMVDFGCRAPVIALLEAFGRHGVTLTEEEARRDMGKPKSDHVCALLNDVRVAEAWRVANGRRPAAQDRDTLMENLGPLMRDQAALAATLIEGARATVEELRAAGLKIASSTGYTREMMQPVLQRAADQGYVPDHVICSGETLESMPATERGARISAAEKALYAAGADIVIESVATLIQSIEKHLDLHCDP